MTNLHIVFNIWFLDSDIAFTRLLRFAARSLGRLSNAFDTRIADTTTALAAAESGTTDVGVKEAIKIAKTQAKNDFRENLPAQIRRIHGAVAGAFGDPSPELTECFPEGRTVFRTCKDEELNNKLGQLVACITVTTNIEPSACTASWRANRARCWLWWRLESETLKCFVVGDDLRSLKLFRD